MDTEMTLYHYILQGVSSLRSLSPCTCVGVFERYQMTELEYISLWCLC